MVFRNLIFPPYFLIYRQEGFSTIPQIGYIMSIAMRSLELALKKQGNYYAVAINVNCIYLSTFHQVYQLHSLISLFLSAYFLV